MLVQKVSVLNLTVLVLILTNAQKILILAVMMRFVLTLKEVTLVNVHLAPMENLIKVFVLLPFVVVLLIVSVGQMKNAYNLENAFAHHHSSLNQAAAKIHVKDFHAELMQNAAQQIHHNVCVKLASKEILSKDVQAPMNAPMHHVHMGLNVSLKKAVINAFVPMECPVILTRVDAFMRIQRLKYNVPQTKTALRISAVAMEIVSALVLIFFAAQTLSANQKIMLDGADAVLDSMRDLMETVFQVSFVPDLEKVTIY